MKSDILYKAVYVPNSHCSAFSPCDLCQRDECIGVVDCHELYGDNYTFIKVKPVKCDTSDFSDDDKRENDEFLAYVTSLP